MESLLVLSRAVIVGVGATALMDLWLMLLLRAGVPTMDFALLGRWVGHLFHGQLAHDAPSGAHHQFPANAAWAGWRTAPPASHSRPGWCCCKVRPGDRRCAAVPVAAGDGRGHRVVAQADATEELCLCSLAKHAVFGLGLYLSAAALTRLAARSRVDPDSHPTSFNTMNQLAIVHHSAHGHTEHIARHVAEGARSAVTAEVDLLRADDLARDADRLLPYSGIILGSPTCLGGVSAPFKGFMLAGRAVNRLVEEA